MQHLRDLLAEIPVPNAKALAVGVESDADASQDGAPDTTPDGTVKLVTNLGAGLPEGHLHLWGGPDGAGKTSFLLSLLSGAAACHRRVLYATYDLPSTTLARRLLAMSAGVEPERLPDPGGSLNESSLDAAAWRRVVAARRYLSSQPFSFLEARGLTTDSLRDRLARMPFRANVLAIDYLQAVVRDRGQPLSAALTNLTELAKGMHVSIVCAVRPDADGLTREGAATQLTGTSGKLPDRVGWLAPAGATDSRAAGTIAAEIVVNRHGPQTSQPLRVRASGAMELT